MERKGRVEDKVALITGVAKPDSIGFATASVFAQEGAMLAIVDIADAVHDCAELLRGEGFTVSSHTADLTKMDQVKKAVDEALTCYGRIDVLVNNAGMVVFGQEEDLTAFQDLTEESWDFGIAINLKTQFNVTRCVVPAHDRGRVRPHRQRLVGDRPGGRQPRRGGVLRRQGGRARHDARPRSGRGQARHHRERGRPGLDRRPAPPPTARTSAARTRRWAGPRYPEEVGKVICFLGSDDASYVTGQLVVVDGGNTIQEYKGPSELYY